MDVNDLIVDNILRRYREQSNYSASIFNEVIIKNITCKEQEDFVLAFLNKIKDHLKSVNIVDCPFSLGIWEWIWASEMWQLEVTNEW